MDTKRLLTMMVILIGVMLAWQWYSNRSTTSTPKGAYEPYAAAIGQAGEKGAAAASITLGDSTSDEDHGGTKVAVTISNVTAGIEKVELNVHDYAQTVKGAKPLVLFEARAADRDVPLLLPFSTTGVHIQVKGEPTERPYDPALPADASATQIAQSNSTLLYKTKYIWEVGPHDQTHLDLIMHFQQAGQPLLKITKTFTIDPKSYEVRISHKIENESGLDVSASVDQLGPEELPRDDPQGEDRVFHAVSLDTAAKKIIEGPIVMQADLVKIGQTLNAQTVTASKTTQPAAAKGSYSGEVKKIKDNLLTLANGGDSYDIVLSSATGVTIDGAIANVTDLKEGMKATIEADVGTRWIGQMSDFGTGKPAWVQNPIAWISASNRFFTTIVRPLDSVPSTGAGPYKLDGGEQIGTPAHVASAWVDLVSAYEPTKDAPEKGLGVVRLTGNRADIKTKGSLELPLTVYMGPKKREVLDGTTKADLNSSDYAHAAYQYKSVIQLSQGCYSRCTYEPVAVVILGVLNFLAKYVTFGNYGIAIMVLVIVVRALLHPLTRYSQINMATMGKKMKDVQPKLEAAKKKFADNRQKLNEATMQIYKENNVNPAGGIMGCLPMLIQMPIWAALYSGLRTDIDLRHASFIPGWINDLASPDTVLPVITRSLDNPLFKLPLLGDIYGLNLLPLLLAVVFFMQMKVTTASQPKAADEQQAQMQKMSQYMIFLFPLFLYKAPSGLNLYIFASTMGGLVDTWLVRKTLKKKGILPASAKALPTQEEKS